METAADLGGGRNHLYYHLPSPSMHTRLVEVEELVCFSEIEGYAGGSIDI